MMKKSFASLLTSLILLPAYSHADSPYFSLKDGDGFKRFSISAGWLHAMPQGKANPVHINTSVAEGTESKVGSIKASTVYDAMDKDKASTFQKTTINGLGDLDLCSNSLTCLSGTATVNGLSSWQMSDSGLEAQDVDTLGILTNYYFTDNWSLEIKAGIPPKVDIKGKGFITAPLSGSATPSGLGTILGDIPLKKDLPITDLTQGKKAASVRAWLPAAELHYQFGRSGVNKFRPYVGVGVMYAYFNDVKLNSGIESDLIAAGHMIQNVLDNKAGAALEGKKSSANPIVNVKATDTFAPIATIGATYDFNENWFAVGSVSYSKMDNDAKITVTDSNTGKELINSKTKIDIDPLITYVGVGYRF